MNYKLTIAYDGSSFGGWQIQPNAVSIQQLIQETIQQILQQTVILIGAGRTDAGVHATGQVAHFKFQREIDLNKFLHSLNSLLPKEIRILDIAVVPDSFHAQRSATSKVYHYHLHLDPIPNPFNRLYSYHVRFKIDVDLMQQAAKSFIGIHDFTSFANEAHQGAASKNAVRHLMRLDIVPELHGVRLEFEADGFLYKMVRNITGTLLEVGRKKRTIEEIPEILLKKDRRYAGIAAPPHGLFLVKVCYQPEFCIFG